MSVPGDGRSGERRTGYGEAEEPAGDEPEETAPDEPEETARDEDQRDETPASDPHPPPRNRRTRGTPGRTCELCGGPVLDRHCKIVCLNCGYQRDCSDP